MYPSPTAATDLGDVDQLPRLAKTRETESSWPGLPALEIWQHVNNMN